MTDYMCHYHCNYLIADACTDILSHSSKWHPSSISPSNNVFAETFPAPIHS